MDNTQDKSANDHAGGTTDGHMPGGPLILVADGSASRREAVAAQLLEQGYRTLTVESGSTALMMLRSERPSLLLVDQNMPGLSGIDLLREMRGNKDSALMPVIITTTTADPAMAIAALNAGADDHIYTPCARGVLAARIERQLDRAREATELRQAVAALDARLIRRTLEIDELLVRIEALSAEKAALSMLLSSREPQPRQQAVKSVAAY